MSDTLPYVLSCLRRASDNAYSWSLTPSEAGALVAEIERLREERPAVVAHLRERAVHGAGNTITVEDACTILADLFERGEHRSEEER